MVGCRDQWSCIITALGTWLSSITAAFDATTSIELPLILYSDEGNQFRPLVREVLTEFRYRLRSTIHGEGDRHDERRWPKLQEDPHSVRIWSIRIRANKCPKVPILLRIFMPSTRITAPNEGLQFVSDTVLSIIRPVFAT
jgi:hypothetical protein